MKFKVNPNDFVSFYVNSKKRIIDKDTAALEPSSVLLESRAIAIGTDVDGYAISIFVEPTNSVDPSDYFWNLCESDSLKRRSKEAMRAKILLSDDIDKYNNKPVIHLISACIAGVRTTKINSVTDFCKCDSCENIVHMAAPNQPDGKTFICYSCRQNPIRKYY